MISFLKKYLESRSTNVNIPEKESDIHYVQGNNKTLFITFGGIKHGLGMDVQPFEFSRSLQNKHADTLYLRDRKQMWYQQGVIGAGDSILEVSSYVKTIS